MVILTILQPEGGTTVSHADWAMQANGHDCGNARGMRCHCQDEIKEERESQHRRLSRSNCIFLVDWQTPSD